MRKGISSLLAVTIAMIFLLHEALSQPIAPLSTFVPSDAGGSEGLYCEIYLPPTPRYAEGAPVVVRVPGGWEAKGITAPERHLISAGFIQILFNFPGGGAGTKKSGGDYDERGENCIRALRDIVLFAMGQKTDKDGKYLGGLTGGITPLYSNVGLCGWSNGGNAAITTAGAFAHDLVGLAWIANWESPVGDGMPNVEAGEKGQVNPAYDPNTGTWDYSRLAFSDTLTVSNQTPLVKGGFYFDLNSNSIFDTSDFKPNAYVFTTGMTKAYYSLRLRTEAENRGLIPVSAPTTLATVEETRAFWLFRNGENWIEAAITGNANLLFMVTASEEDHVQGAPDHPHILIQYEAFRNAGARFVRLNPDRAYVEAIGEFSCPQAVDNPAFISYDHLSIRTAVEPEELDYNLIVNAGVIELADRTQISEISAQLDSVLSGGLQPIEWKSFFTLAPDEGTEFVEDTTAIVEGGGAPVLNITNDGAIILTSAVGPQPRVFEVRDNGKTYFPLSSPLQRGADGGFVYLPDGRTRFLTEEPAPGNTPQRHKSRIVSWISTDGLTWEKEMGIRYQPGAEDDSIASVPAIIQVQDSVWRMYYVGDWYRINGIRTAISTDWGWTWTAESKGNILRKGDVDPHPVYLSNGRIRLYCHSGMNRASPEQSGISYSDSDDGVHFDTLQVKLVIKDSDRPTMLKLDPAVIKFPNGDIACYLGAMPPLNQSTTPKLLVAWAKKPTGVKTFPSGSLLNQFQLEQNYPNPFNQSTTIRFSLTPSLSHGERMSEGQVRVTLKVFDALGREITTLINGELDAGEHSVVFDTKNLSSGVYFYRLTTPTFSQTKPMEVLK